MSEGLLDSRTSSPIASWTQFPQIQYMLRPAQPILAGQVFSEEFRHQ